MRNLETRLGNLEKEAFAQSLRNDRQYFSSLSKAELDRLLAAAQPLDAALVSACLGVSEADLMEVARELGPPRRGDLKV